MRWEEGEAGGSGMGWRLRAPGEREAATFPTSNMRTGPGLAHEGAAALPSHGVASRWTLSSSPSSSSPWPTSGGCLRSRVPAVAHARQEAGNEIPHLDPGSSQAEGSLSSGEVREGANVTFSGRLPWPPFLRKSHLVILYAPSSFPS